MPEIVLVARKEFDKAADVFRSVADFDFQPTDAEETLLADAVRRTKCRAVVVGADRYVGPLYEALDAAGGGLIARFGVGCDNIDKTLAERRHVAVANTPGTLDASVAEHAVWLLGCLARRIASADRRFHEGRFFVEPGIELFGKTLGLVGFGAIARRVAAIAHFGFGMNVWAVGRRTVEEVERRHGGGIEQLERAWGIARYTNDLDAALRKSDAVSVHLPSNSETRHIFNAERFARMKPGAMFVNTARGAVVDEAALYDALAAGRLVGAGLDVFENEPYCPVRPDKDLRLLENVVLTPHAASNTRESNRRMGEMCVENVRRFFAL